jgi:WhiB family redox-sensing transcriptional regulator
MSGFEQMPGQLNGQASGAIGAVSLGMPMPREALNHPFMQEDLSDIDTDPLAWQADGTCAQTDPEAFFPEKGGSTREAKKICIGCEVKPTCLEYALQNNERFGIWGGLSERERRKLQKRTI